MDIKQTPPWIDVEGYHECLPSDLQKRIDDFFNDELDRKLDDGFYESFSAKNLDNPDLENRDSSMKEQA